MTSRFLHLSVCAGALLAAPAFAQDDINLAFFSAWGANSYNNAIYQGALDAAEEAGGVNVDIFDGSNDAALQFTQVEDIVTSGGYDAFVISPNDATGIEAAVQMAVDSGMAGAATLFPIGPDLTTLAPQVEGLVATAANLPVPGATLQAEAVAEYCADIAPCKVVAIVGQMIYPTDNMRYEAYQAVFAEHENIEIVSTIEGKYSPDETLTAMTDMLLVNPDIDAIVSVADQHLVGAEIALEDAGIDPTSIYMMGAGASDSAIAAIREGRWSATLGNYPYTMGYLATQAVIASLRGETVEPEIDMDVYGPLPAIITQDVLLENPDFLGEWQG
ncbi:sugar ABC transporter substrate-binding protein [Pseudoroseicyclus sp. CXY001]|uniref:sugar ABC transporter substrate-binding protein n=1 Tax=Pseudoroseicyclus sp. CXY001 TaxID=3242492 RepID=UPI00357128F3